MKVSAEKLKGKFGESFILSVAAGLFCTLIFTSLNAGLPNLLLFADNLASDLLTARLPEEGGERNAVIVDIDERSIDAYGQWPWPRYLIAGLAGKIAEAGPASVGIDIVFPEPDRTSFDGLLEEMERHLGMSLDVRGMEGVVRDNDTEFAASLEKGPFVLASKLLFDGNALSTKACEGHPLIVSMLSREGEPTAPALTSADGLLCSVPPLMAAVDHSGFINTLLDADGSLRRTPLLVQHDGRYVPSLDLALLVEAQGLESVTAVLSRGRIEWLIAGPFEIPLDLQGNLLLKYRGGKGAFTYISAADILSDGVGPEALRGKVVLLGTSAFGLGDNVFTPKDPLLPGVEVHATVVDNIMKGDFLREPHWSRGTVLMLVIVLGILSTLLLAGTKAIWNLPILAASVGVVCYASYWLVQRHGILISPVYPAFTVLGNFVLLTFLRFGHEEFIARNRTRELVLTQDVTIESMASLAEYRDPETGGHIMRTRIYVRILAEYLAEHPHFKDFLNENTIELLYKSAPLHDIGKVGIHDDILLKPALLNAEEFEIMKTHTIIGHKVLLAAERKLGVNSFLKLAGQIARTHQEKWDGSGYPDGLKGEEIPLPGRLMALADVYDALISKRVYKSPFPHSEAVTFIREGRGSHFDPHLVDAFEALRPRFLEIAKKFADFPEEVEMRRRDEEMNGG